MEDTHGAIMEFTENTSNWTSLNPYCNGRYSWSYFKEEGTFVIC